MEDSGKSSSNNNKKIFNSWVLQFQKMGLELKCPLCLNLFSRPMLLPCNHMFCKSCISDCPMPGSQCAICNTQYAHKDLRQMPFVESMVTIYRSLDVTFSANMLQQLCPDGMRILEPCQASGLHHFNEVGIEENQRERSGVVMRGKSEECSQLEARGHEECGVVEMEMETSQATQSLPDSPPFCDTNGSDNDFSDQDRAHALKSVISVARKLESSSLKRASKATGNSEVRSVRLRSENSASKSDGLMRELKRQKNLVHGALNVSLKCDNHVQVQPSVPHHNKSVDSSCKLKLKSGTDPGELLMTIPDNSCSNTSICSFCQSSKISEATGPMLHYANGNLVTGDAAVRPNVIHVHGICIDWAPQVYYVGESIKNLKAEVSRGAKLKCSKCGLKGAALGCYVKSCRRTYHVLCAMEISTCRWDHEDFLMLCPAHRHVSFPNEKSKSKKDASKKHPVTSHLVSQASKPSEASTDDCKNWVFCGSALSTDEKILLIDFANKIGATVTKFWTPKVTHVIAATDANGACSRTLKVLMAILNGQWVLKMDWIRASMEVIHPVEKEPYEISLDNHGCLGGPKTGRLQALTNEPKLFSGLNFYFSGDYMPLYNKKDLENLVVAGGGSVLGSKEELEAEGHEREATSSKLLVVYNLDPPQGRMLGEEVSILWQRLSEAEDLAAKTGSQVIGHTWLLESIAAFKLQAFVS